MAIGVVVEEHIKEGQLEAYLGHMAEMVELTKQEDGCIAYDIYEEKDGSGGIVILEIWESEECLEKHMASEHFQRLIPTAEAYLEKPHGIRVFNRL